MTPSHLPPISSVVQFPTSTTTPKSTVTLSSSVEPTIPVVEATEVQPFPGWATFLLVFFGVVAVCSIGFYYWKKIYCSQAPSGFPPGINSNRFQNWVCTYVRKFKNNNNRRAHGAYEPSSYQSRTGRISSTHNTQTGYSFDPDAAWDTRIGREAGHYENQELGLDPQKDPIFDYFPSTSTSGTRDRYNSSLHDDDHHQPAAHRNRSRSRYDRKQQDFHQISQNPFSDDAAAEPILIGLNNYNYNKKQSPPLTEYSPTSTVGDTSTNTSTNPTPTTTTPTTTTTDQY